MGKPSLLPGFSEPIYEFILPYNTAIRWLLLQYIAVKILQDTVKSISTNVNEFDCTMFKTTLVVRCSQDSLIFFKSNTVRFNPPIFPISPIFFCAILRLVIFVIGT